MCRISCKGSKCAGNHRRCDASSRKASACREPARRLKIRRQTRKAIKRSVPICRVGEEYDSTQGQRLAKDQTQIRREKKRVSYLPNKNHYATSTLFPQHRTDPCNNRTCAGISNIAFCSQVVHAYVRDALGQEPQHALTLSIFLAQSWYLTRVFCTKTSFAGPRMSGEGFSIRVASTKFSGFKKSQNNFSMAFAFLTTLHENR